MYIWLQWEKLTRKKLLGCYSVAITLYWTTKSDSCIILLLFLILVQLRKNQLIHNLAICISKYSFFLLGILNFALARLYIGCGYLTALARKIDILFNRRLAMAYLAIQDNGLSLCGQSITKLHKWNSLFNFGNYTIDSLYIYFYVCIGIVYFFLISFGFYKIGKKYENYRAAIVILTFSLYSMVEVHCLYLSNCFALLLLKCVIFRNQEIK